MQCGAWENGNDLVLVCNLDARLGRCVTDSEGFGLSCLGRGGGGGLQNWK